VKKFIKLCTYLSTPNIQRQKDVVTRLIISISSFSIVVGSERTWIHPPDALQKGHIAYLVKVRINIPLVNIV
jgi:hypothetical protein